MFRFFTLIRVNVFLFLSLALHIPVGARIVTAHPQDIIRPLAPGLVAINLNRPIDSRRDNNELVWSYSPASEVTFRFNAAATRNNGANINNTPGTNFVRLPGEESGINSIKFIINR